MTLFPNLTLLPTLTLLPIRKVFIEHLQQVQLANRGRFPIGHMVLSHLGLAFVLMLSPFSPELVMFPDLEFRSSLGTSNLLITRFREFCVEHLQRIWLANRGRLLLRIHGPVPIWICICSLILRPVSLELVKFVDFEFRVSLCTSILLCLGFYSMQYLSGSFVNVVHRERTSRNSRTYRSLHHNCNVRLRHRG